MTVPALQQTTQTPPTPIPLSSVAPPEAPAGQLEPEDEPDDEDEPAVPAQPSAPAVGRQGKEIPAQAISQVKSDVRAKERRRILIAEYGTADPDEITRIKTERQIQADEYKRLKTDQETAKKASMSETDQLKSTIEEQKAKISTLENRIKELSTSTKVERQDRMIADLASRHIDSDVVDYAKHKFQKHLRDTKPEHLKRIDQRYIEKWFSKFAADNKRFAKTAPEPAHVEAEDTTAEPLQTQTPTKPKLVIKQPLRPGVRPPQPINGRVPVKPVARPTANSGAPDLSKGKTPRPGQPNSMNKAELREYMTSRGLKPY